jgi:hypothetical protein
MDKNPSSATVKTPSSNFRLEPVADEQYLAAHSTAGM